MTATKKIDRMKVEAYDKHGIDMIEHDKVIIKIFDRELTIQGEQANKLKAQVAAELAAAIIAHLEPAEIKSVKPHELEELPAHAVNVALTALALCS